MGEAAKQKTAVWWLFLLREGGPNLFSGSIRIMTKHSDSPVPSTARDYLANERTLLAYVRTALAFVGFGFVVARFSLFGRELDTVAPRVAPTMHVSVALGVAMVIVGVAFATFGAVRYIGQDRALRQDRIAGLSERSAVGMTLVVVIFGSIVAYDLMRLQLR
ncbi:MAG: DUF202 domain-containing protein [Candidatus Eremiobacteraeota bacterium]|nr:DUF202 domain-containing protein [Candidatus Eremiobacteraeota bacterium]